ncbi:MAG: hypothetical protein ACPGE9_08665, partial [Algiphilus sp.]
MPLFEAVQNSIHAIEGRSEEGCDGQIIVDILRNPQRELSDQESRSKKGPDSQPEIVGFRIRDNGEGFTPVNYESFETLDSDLKAAIGGRGVGRLLWLKAFESVSVESIYRNGDTMHSRRFTFSATQAGLKNQVQRFREISPFPG